jgi:hypothetical protein
MVDFQSIVTVSSDTQAQAEQVLAERLGFEEDYGFDYSVSSGKVVAASDLQELTEMLRFAQEAAAGDSNDAEIAAWQSAAQYAAELLGVPLP